MTEIYDWNPMPHNLDVKCPGCANRTTFEFAEIVKIKLKKDIPFFQDSDLFEYSIFRDSCAHKWHAAIYYSGLHGSSTSAIRDLPDGYVPENWSHSSYLIRQRSELGSISCLGCGYIQKHRLNWPEDAYYSIQYKGDILWAFNEESAITLRNFILSNTRDVNEHKWKSFLRHVPKTFKLRGAREHVVKHFDRLLK